MLKSKPDGYALRVWVVGCSTGEEAYSIAIVLEELIQTCERRIQLQIFATDIDDDAIDVARMGVYPPGIAGDMSNERLERYLHSDDHAFTVNKLIRDKIVFAPQNVLEDPPFTKLDLLVCRNLMIYLEGVAQHRLLPMFHYALKPEGILFLGPSDRLGNLRTVAAVDAKWRVFRRTEPDDIVPNSAFHGGGWVPDHAVGRGVRRRPKLERAAEQLLLSLMPPSGARAGARHDRPYSRTDWALPRAGARTAPRCHHSRHGPPRSGARAGSGAPACELDP